MLARWPYDEKPLLVFWETTKACMLACKHCRAEAITKPLPGELSTEEARSLVDQVAEFGKPYPILVLTGGDPLMRKDLWDIVDYAVSKGIRVGLAPAVTPLLDEKTIEEIRGHRVASVSISLDSPWPEVHDEIRGIKGTWERSVWAIKRLRERGIRVQVNTVVMKSTVNGLPDMVKLLLGLGVDTWEVFYLVPVGRAGREEDLAQAEWEDVSHFLYEASKYGIAIRTTEGPMFRRIVFTRQLLEKKGIDPDKVLPTGKLYRELVARLRSLLGKPSGPPRAHSAGTRDGRGIVFISYRGDVYPSGFLPVPAGNIRRKSLREIYQNSPLFRKLRAASFTGRCGSCEFRYICGGSRARAYAYTGNPLGEDPACPYTPGSYAEKLRGLGVDLEAELSLLVSKRAQKPGH